MDHAVRRGQDAGVLGRQVGSPAEQQHVAFARIGRRNFAKVTPRSLKQRLSARRFRPVARIGRDRLDHRAAQLPENADEQSQAIAADAFQRALVAIGRAEPAARRRDDLGARRHSTSVPPSCAPALVG
jgi:hypothetical protein